LNPIEYEVSADGEEKDMYIKKFERSYPEKVDLSAKKMSASLESLNQNNEKIKK